MKRILFTFIAAILVGGGSSILVSQGNPTRVDMYQSRGAPLPPAVCQNESLPASGGRQSGTATSSTAGLLELVALTTNQVIYPCDLEVFTADDNTLTFVYGTGTACATGETAIAVQPWLGDGTFNLGLAHPGGGFVIQTVPVSQAWCVRLSASVATRINFVYVKRLPPS